MYSELDSTSTGCAWCLIHTTCYWDIFILNKLYLFHAQIMVYKRSLSELVLGPFLTSCHWNITLNVTFTVWPFKCQVHAVAGALFSLNAHCRAMVSFLDEKDVHIIWQHCPIRDHNLKWLLWHVVDIEAFNFRVSVFNKSEKCD
jgi:hypothetical protein